MTPFFHEEFFKDGFICQQTDVVVSTVFQPVRIEGTEIIRRLLQHPECQGHVD